jgi:hypothetical protein
MNTEKYIKVTPKDLKESFVVTAVNADFHKSQGAKVEQATEEEILSYFPEEKATEATKELESIPVEETEEYKALQKSVQILIEDQKKVFELELEAAKVERDETVKSLTEELGASKTELSTVKLELEAAKVEILKQKK